MPSVLLYTGSKPIRCGEELTFDYNFSSYSRDLQNCLCRSANCTGYFGSTKMLRRSIRNVGYREQVSSLGAPAIHTQTKARGESLVCSQEGLENELFDDSTPIRHEQMHRERRYIGHQDKEVTQHSPPPHSEPERSRNNAARLCCPKAQCAVEKPDRKSFHRHIMEKHDRPILGETKAGWFRCACGLITLFYRKTNHTRHLKNCHPSKWVLTEFLCQCRIKHSKKIDHISHYEKCRIGRNPVGRPHRTKHKKLGFL